MTEHSTAPGLALARDIAGRYASLRQVQTVTLGGSYATGQAGPDCMSRYCCICFD